MTYAEILVPEFDHEMQSTRKVLERVPDDKLDWRAHPKSNTIRWVASHLVEIPSWVEETLTQPSWETEPEPGKPYRTPQLGSQREMLDAFDKHVQTARKALAAVTNDAMKESWSLLRLGKPILTMPRADVVRYFILNHTIHHRAILTVYLRLNDVPVPGMYGPSGDE